MLSPCARCSPLHCVINRSNDCLSAYTNLRRIGNSPGGFAACNESPEQWSIAERVFYQTQTKGLTDMARGRPPKTNTQAEQLMQALEFVSMASVSDDDQPHHAHVMLTGKMAIASTGQISAGHPITEELELSPHLDKFIAALKRCGKTLQIAQTPAGQLSIKGDKLRAVVPSLSNGEMVFTLPEPSVAVIDDKLKGALKVCNSMASEAAESVMFASVLLQAYSAMSVLGFGKSAVGLVEAWHGIDLPPNMILPKVFTAAVCKTDYKLTGFGFTWSQELNRPGSVTFWFENGAWLKTQCYSDTWSDVTAIIGANCFPKDVPPGLFEGVDAAAQFSEDKEPSVYFVDGKVMSHPSDDVGGVYEVRGLEGGKRFNAKVFNKMAPFVKQLDLTTYPDRAYFHGGEDGAKVRGVFMGTTGGFNYPSAKQEPEPANTGWPTEPAGTIGGAQIQGDDDADDEGVYLHSRDDAGEYQQAERDAQANTGGYEIDTDVNPNLGWNA